MDVQIISRESLSTSEWSGGTTTQLAIYPPSSLYARRDFIWRVSTAKVEVEESVFTALPGVRRVLMILQGQMHLIHEGHHQVELAKFDQDSFRGDWVTTSHGKVTDFNLMITQGDGCVTAIHTPPSVSSEIILDFPGEKRQWSFMSHILYFLAPVEVTFPGQEVLSMQSGDVLICKENLPNVSSNYTIKLLNRATVPAHVIRASVGHN